MLEARTSPLVTFWRNLKKFDGSEISASLAARNALCITIPLLIGAWAGHPGSGIIAASGALNAAFSDGHDPYKRRTQKMTAASIMCGIAVFFGAVTGNNHLLAVGISCAWAFGVGMLGALGAAASDVGNVSLFTLCVYASQSMTPTDAALSGLLAMSGGFLQTASALILWPTLPYQPERRALGILYLSISDIAAAIPYVTGEPAATTQINQAQTALNSLTRDRTEQADRFLALLQNAEKIRLSLLVLVRLRRRIAREIETVPGIQALDNFTTQYAADLDLISYAIGTGNYAKLPNLQTTRQLAKDFQAYSWPGDSAFVNALVRDTQLQFDTLVKQLDAVLELFNVAKGTTPRDPIVEAIEQPWYLNLRSRAATLQSNLNTESAVFRHALRLSICIAVGDASARFLHMGRAYWAPMTIAIVLKPDFSSTFTRGILRIVGTMLGLTLATVLFHASPTGVYTHIVFIAALSFFMRWLGPGNYGIVAVTVTGIVVMMVAGTGIPPNEVIVARAGNTILGGTLALLSYALWPTWEKTRIRPVIADLLDTYRIYFKAVMEVYRGANSDKLDGVRQAARVARTNAIASLDRAAVEPATDPAVLTNLNATVARSHDFVKCVMALEAALPKNRVACDTEHFRQFVNRVDEDLACLSEALRSPNSNCKAALPETPPRLTMEKYSLLNQEAERMVRALDLLAQTVG